jgi:hypothetical protein
LKASREAKANYLPSAELLCNLKNYKTTKLKKNSKQTNIKEQTWKGKNENMKLEKRGNLPQVVVLFVCPPPHTKTRTQGIYM